MQRRIEEKREKFQIIPPKRYFWLGKSEDQK
jgi:hypothetical protein